MSNTPAVTDATWQQEVLDADKPVLIDFWAEWCGPCRMVAPVIDEIAGEQAEHIKVVKLNVDENPDTARQYRVMSIPTMLVVADGVEKKRIVGAKSKDALLGDLAEFF
jgi:thioredoxin 1